MTNFSHILDWKLQAGSHEFPGLNGGTCINEAAMVAAGFEYCSISSADDMPPCTSRVIATYALRLNDGMPDAERQKLLPFVTRILGTADTPDIERQRVEYLAIETVRRVLPLALRRAGLGKEAEVCEAVRTIGEARTAADAAATAADAAAYAATNATNVTNVTNATNATAATAYAVTTATNAARAATAAEAWDAAISILDGCMKIGRQPDALDVQIVKSRMDAVREQVTA